MGWNPLWAWLCSVSDPQDAIKELFKCVLCIWVPSQDEKRRPDVDRRLLRTWHKPGKLTIIIKASLSGKKETREKWGLFIQ